MATSEQIGQILLKAKLIDALQLRSVMARVEQWGGRLPYVLVEMGALEEEPLVQVLSKALRYPVAQVENVPVAAEALSRVEATFAEKHALLPLQLKEGEKVLVVAMADPSNLEVIDTLSRKTRLRVVPMLAGEHAILRAIRFHYHHDRRTLSAQELLASTLAGERELSPEDLGGYEAMTPYQSPSPSRTFEAYNPSPELSETGRFLSQALTDSQSMLAEILNGSTPSVFSPEQEARILALSENQKKTTRILRAVEQLLAEKGLR